MKQDSGQVLVIVALLMVVLLGVSAVAIDIGIEKVAVTRLKNVASASALAGATAQAQGTSVTDAVNASILANGKPLSSLMPTSGANPNPSITSTTVQVSLAEPHSFFLAPILGYSTATITQLAEATLIPSGGISPFDYAVFSDQALDLHPHDYITGVVHSNSTVDLSGLNNSPLSYFTGGIESIGGVNYRTDSIDATKTTLPFNNNAQYISITTSTPNPATIAANLLQQAKDKNHWVNKDNWKDRVVNGVAIPGTLQPNSWDPVLKYQWTYSNGTFSMSGSNPSLSDGPWYFEGDLDVNPGGNGFTVSGAVVATGQISLGGGGLKSTGSSGLAFYSLLGSPQFPNTNNRDCIFASITQTTNTATGTFYAPYGSIDFGGGVPIIKGSVIGKKVTADNNITVIYDQNSLSNQLLTGTGPSSFRAYLTK